jgi:VanZ family protein
MYPEPKRGWLLLAACAYVVFVVYGSLVPLDFRPQPLEAAWGAFRDIRYLQLGLHSRADWVANILLFVPLSFLWLGTLWPRHGAPLRVAASALVLAWCVALAMAIEFTQIFFPPRTVSLNDIYAESIGAVAGIAAWWMFGPGIMSWFAGWFRAHTPRDAAARLLYGYLFVLFGYNVLPLDLTISPVELFHKWRAGKVVLIPFSASFPSAAERAYGLLTDVAIWVPAAFLWRVSSSRTVGSVVGHVVAAAALLELLQFFVYSRVTDVTDILTAAIGGLLGALLGGMVAARSQPRGVAADSGTAWLGPLVWLAGLLAFIAVLAAVFWYPFDFRTDWGFVRERVAALPSVPFTAYYFGTEFRAVTEVLHKVGFFLPLGAWLAWGAAAVGRRFRVPAWLLHASSICVIAGTAAGIEFGQIFLPSKNADPTDFVLATIGGLAGYFGFRWLLRAWAPGIGVSREN